MTPVQSSNVGKLGYDRDSGSLVVEFKNGGRYLYLDVEKFHYDAMTLGSGSVGKYFSENIRNKYRCIKL